MVQHINGIVDELIEQALERVANGVATDNDRFILVISGLMLRQQEHIDAMRPRPLKLFGREWSAPELAFVIGGLVVIDTAAVTGLVHVFGG